MVDFVGRTLESLNNLFGTSGLFGSAKGNVSSTRVTKFDLIGRLKLARTKHAEEEIVTAYLSSMAKRFSFPDITNSEIEDYMQIAMLCEMLGHPAHFIYIHALKLAQKGNLQQKQIGYLAAASLLHPDHELVILLVNTIQKDIRSTNIAEIKLGLKSVCCLVNLETVSEVLHLVEEKLYHESASVRKLAVLAMEYCLQTGNSWSAYQMAVPKLEKVLADSDLSVIFAVTAALYNIIKKSPGQFGYLVDSLLQLQYQLLERNVPKDMEYHSIPVPWLQIRILKMFAILGNNEQLSQKIYPVLKATLQKAEVNQNVAYAIIFECIETVANLKYDEQMIQLVLSSTSKLLRSESANLKYMGVKALASVIKKIKPSLAISQQESVMDCLSHPDETLKLKTLDLLYHMANSSNVQAICEKMVEFMTLESDKFIQKDLMKKILEIAKQYGGNNMWYISTVNSVLYNAGNIVPINYVFDIINKLEKDEDGKLKTFARTIYLDMFQEKQIPVCLIPVVSSVFKELPEGQEYLLRALQYADEDFSLWLLFSLQNIILKTKNVPCKLPLFLKEKTFTSKLVQQKCEELLNIIDCVEDNININFFNKVDPTLSFLDDYVCHTLEAGLSCYKPHSYQTVVDFSSPTVSSPVEDLLQHNQISSPEDSQASSIICSPSYHSMGSEGFTVHDNFTTVHMLPVHKEVKKVWTKDGRLKEGNAVVKEKAVCSTAEKDSKSINEHKELCKALFSGLSSDSSYSLTASQISPGESSN